MLQFINEMVYEFQPDLYFWQEIRKILISDFEEKYTYRYLLKILGFDPKFASCNNCSGKTVNYFYKSEQIFFCQKCASKIPKDKVILIE